MGHLLQRRINCWPSGWKWKSRNTESLIPAELQKIIQTTLIWNISLRKTSFSLFVYPLLWLIKNLNREKFEQILGARIKFHLQNRLPDYYFEDIASIQSEMISVQLDKLDKLLSLRIHYAKLAAEAGQSILGRGVAPSLSKTDSRRFHTFWQFVVPVKNLSNARDALFRRGVETGATNLFNLAAVKKIELAKTKELKESHIFIPLHGHISEKKYQKIFKIINEAK